MKWSNLMCIILYFYFWEFCTIYSDHIHPLPHPRSSRSSPTSLPSQLHVLVMYQVWSVLAKYSWVWVVVNIPGVCESIDSLRTIYDVMFSFPSSHQIPELPSWDGIWSSPLNWACLLAFLVLAFSGLVHIVTFDIHLCCIWKPVSLKSICHLWLLKSVHLLFNIGAQPLQGGVRFVLPIWQVKALEFVTALV